MAFTLDEVEKVVRGRGIECHRLGRGPQLATLIPTKAYKDAKGEHRIAVFIWMDETNSCLVMNAPWAFDSRDSRHKEALLACLLGASCRSAFVRPQVDPADGEVRLRIDSALGKEGLPPETVVRMLEAITAFADAWYPQIKSAMEKGSYDLEKSLPSSPVKSFQILTRRVGSINRLRALLRWQQQRNPPPAGEDPSRN